MDSLLMQLVFLSFFSYLIPVKGAAKSNQVIRDELQESNLTCYTCSTFDNYTCRRLNGSTEESFSIPRRDCKPEEIYCSVTRVEYMTNERVTRTFWALERGCSSICIPGCIILGEGERTKLHLCNSCCTSSLCNVNDLGLKLDPILSLHHFLITIVNYFLFFRPFVDP